VDVVGAVDVADLERHVGMLLRELNAQPVHDVPEAPADPDANPVLLAARHLSGDLAELRTRRVERPCSLEQPPAVIGQCHAMAMTQEQRETEFFSSW
jgi:hypothetical protein